MPEQNDQFEFVGLSEYRKWLTQQCQQSYSHHGYIFAPGLQDLAEQVKQRSLLERYMVALYQLALGAAILQIEVAGNREIDLAMTDGRVYQMGGLDATLVETETFSFHSTEPGAVGRSEWLPFFLDETYIDRNGTTKQKVNQKALNLAFKKPQEPEVVAEVHQLHQRWLRPVLDMMRHHWEVRETIEGQMVLNLYYEYTGNVRRIQQQLSGEGNQAARAERIETLMSQLLLDIEEVRQTTPQRRYTSQEIIAAIRRAIRGFCVDMNRRIIALLGGKRLVSMFVDGQLTVVYHTIADPNNWRSLMLSGADLALMAERAFIRLALSDLNRSKQRMDQKARETYAPVAHAETRMARGEAEQEEQEHGFEEEPAESLPFGLSFAGAEDADAEPGEASLSDTMAHQSGWGVQYEALDLKSLPWAVAVLQGNDLKIVHRYPTKEEAIRSMHSAREQAKAPDRFAQQVRLLHDPAGRLGTEGSQRLLRTLEPEFQTQIQQQGDRYWLAWTVVRRTIGAEGGDLLVVEQRYSSAVEAALALRQALLVIKAAQPKPEQFRQQAALLKLLHDPDGDLPATGTVRGAVDLPEPLKAQLETNHYRMARGQIVLCVEHLGAGAETAAQALAAQQMQEARQAKQQAEAVQS